MKTAAAFFLLMFALVSKSFALSEQDINSMQVKALFLYNFANFVEWPDDAFSTQSSPIKICLYGDVPFGTFLDAVQGSIVGDRRLNIQRTSNLSDIKEGCQILFVGNDKDAQLPDFWRNIQYFYVLSVGEQEKFADNGGIINILRTTDRVQFQLNISNALAAGLFLSSDLLSLAREIKRNTEEIK